MNRRSVRKLVCKIGLEFGWPDSVHRVHLYCGSQLVRKGSGVILKLFIENLM